MYKRFSIDELKTIQNEFIPHLYRIIQQEKCQWINDFFKVAFKEGNEVYYFDRWEVSFKIVWDEEWNKLHFLDEKEKIEVEILADQKGGLQDLIKNFMVKQRQSGQKTIKEILAEEFLKWEFAKMIEKPYLVYDIETSLIGDRLEDTDFYIWYYMEEKEPWKAEYYCITQESLEEFVDKMLGFDGWIVGFNQMYFDNPVCVYNLDSRFETLDARNEAIKILNDKSLDLFQFVRKLTGKRIWLNKLSDDLLWMQKNLEWWGGSVESLWKERKHTWNEKILEKIKLYCENDVKMTVFLLYYLIYFKKLYLDGDEYVYNFEEFVSLANGKFWEKKEKESWVKAQELL